MASSWQERMALDKAAMGVDDVGATSSSLLFYSLLPSLVQRRVPKLHFLRRAVSQYDTPSCHGRKFNQPSGGDFIPPPSYSSEIEEIESTTSADDRTIIYNLSNDIPPRPHTSSSSAIPSRPSTSGSATATSTAHDAHESKSGIRWRYADPGFSLLNLASQEASSFAGSSTFVRRQYIDGVACMLRGLPSDLTAEEEMAIREALPLALLANDRDRLSLIRSAGGMGNLSRRAGGKHGSLQRSALHQCVAMLTLHMFLAVAAVLPYLQLFVRMAWQYDRKYKISDRLLAKSVEAADVVGKRTLVLAQNFCALNEGKVGDVMRDAGIYLVQGFSGGVYDGLGEAIRLRSSEDGEASVE